MPILCPQPEAQRRVSDTEIKAKDSIKDAADQAAKAGSFFSFWMFMALLFAAATLRGIVGGELRADDAIEDRMAAR